MGDTLFFPYLAFQPLVVFLLSSILHKSPDIWKTPQVSKMKTRSLAVLTC